MAPPRPAHSREERARLCIVEILAVFASCLVLAEVSSPGFSAGLGSSFRWQAWTRGMPGRGNRCTSEVSRAAVSESNAPVLVAEKDRPGDGEDAEEAAIQPISWLQKPKPPALPPTLFKPKVSLAQRFIGDPNYLFKIVNEIDDESEGGKRVIELGPGTGAVTSRLWRKYPEMVGVEIDQRALRVLAQKVPGATVIRSDALLINYTKLAEIRGGPLTVASTLPFHVATQLVFTLLDHAPSIRNLNVVMQKEVADRVCARPGSKKYGIPSVAFQLYADVTKLFDIPPKAFVPEPEVFGSYVKLDFEAAKERRLALNVDPRDLRNLTTTAFRGRGKMMQNSLERLLRCHETLINKLPEEYAKVRPHQLEPWEFVHLTQLVFGKKEFPRHFRFSWRGEFGRTVLKEPR